MAKVIHMIATIVTGSPCDSMSEPVPAYHNIATMTYEAAEREWPWDPFLPAQESTRHWYGERRVLPGECDREDRGVRRRTCKYEQPKEE